MKLSIMLIAAMFSVLLFSCSSNEGEKECKKPTKTMVTNPNGDSELALAMRTIFDQTDEIKKSLNEGKLVIPENYTDNLKKFHTAVPTDPDVKIDEFFAFVNVIDKLASDLDKSADLETQKEQYSKVINACIQCHQSFCPGPIRRIKKLKLPRYK